MSPGREWRPTPGRRPPWWPEGEPFPPERWGRRGYGPPPFIRWIGCFVVSAFVVALLAGGALLLAAIRQWWLTGFGHLDYAYTMRFVVPGATLVALGVQTVFSSFFVSILGMRRK